MNSSNNSSDQEIETPSALVGPQPPPPLPPRKPDPYECCGTGCIPCVMDIYEEQVWQYEKKLKAWAHAANPPN